MIRQWFPALNLYKTHRLAGQVVAVLQPLIDLEDVQQRQWLSSFRLGFLATVVDRLGRDIDPGLDVETAGLLQIQVWPNLTHVPGEFVGERLLTLSLAQDTEFLQGCEAGLIFATALSVARDITHQHVDDTLVDNWRDLLAAGP